MSEAKSKKVTEKFMMLLSEHDYDDVTLAMVADASGLTLSELRKLFDGKLAILSDFSRRIDAKVLDDIDEDVAEELPRERLMDILLSRFDALQPYKKAMASIVRAAKHDLSLGAKLNRISLVSMTWMLNAAKIDTSGLNGAMKVQGTSVVYVRVLRVWINDDESMTKTMARLDRELRKGERTISRVNRVSSLLKPFVRSRRTSPSQTTEDILNTES